MPLSLRTALDRSTDRLGAPVPPGHTQAPPLHTQAPPNHTQAPSHETSAPPVGWAPVGAAGSSSPCWAPENAAGVGAMSVSRLAPLLGCVPATAWRASSKASGSGAEVAGGVAKAWRREKVFLRGKRLVSRASEGAGCCRASHLRLGHPRLGPGQVPSPSQISGVGLGLEDHASPSSLGTCFLPVTLVGKGSKPSGLFTWELSGRTTLWCS